MAENKLKQEFGGDFEVMYCQSTKRHYWLLGYFGGGSINVAKAMEVAKRYCEIYGTSIESVLIDEISQSRRYKYFKVIYSNEDKELVEIEEKPYVNENVWGFITS